MPGRKFSVGNQYRYGFNGKENDNEVKGAGNQQDYGFRIYDPRISRFFAVDPITKKYPELTPYQFASNRPIDGIDLDGLEFVSYKPSNNSTIIFPSTRDAIIEQQYQYALSANMNVLISDNLISVNKYLAEKGNKYNSILFGGHGSWNSSRINLPGGGYSEEDIQGYKSQIKEMSSYINKDGSLILLQCFGTTPKYQETIPPKDGTPAREIDINKEDVARELACISGVNVVGNQGETFVDLSGNHIFDSKSPQGLKRTNPEVYPYGNLNNKFAGNWSLITPGGKVIPLGNLILNDDGTYTKTQEKPDEVTSKPNPKAPKPDSGN